MTLCVVELSHPDDPAHRVRAVARRESDGTWSLWLPTHPDAEVAMSYRPLAHFSDYVVTQALAQLGNAAQSA